MNKLFRSIAQLVGKVFRKVPADWEDTAETQEDTEERSVLVLADPREVWKYYWTHNPSARFVYLIERKNEIDKQLRRNDLSEAERQILSKKKNKLTFLLGTRGVERDANDEILAFAMKKEDFEVSDFRRTLQRQPYVG